MREILTQAVSVAGKDRDRNADVPNFPGFETADEDGVVAAVADAVQQVHLDLVRAVFEAKARRCSKKLEQVVSQVGWLNS